MLMLAGYSLSELRGRHLLLAGMIGAFDSFHKKRTFYAQNPDIHKKDLKYVRDTIGHYKFKSLCYCDIYLGEVRTI